MIGRTSLVDAAHANDEAVGGAGGPWNAPVGLLDGDLDVSMLDVMEVGFDYAVARFPGSEPELRQVVHSAWVFGAITMARAMRDEIAHERAA